MKIQPFILVLLVVSCAFAQKMPTRALPPMPTRKGVMPPLPPAPRPPKDVLKPTQKLKTKPGLKMFRHVELHDEWRTNGTEVHFWRLPVGMRPEQVNAPVRTPIVRRAPKTIGPPGPKADQFYSFLSNDPQFPGQYFNSQWVSIPTGTLNLQGSATWPPVWNTLIRIGWNNPNAVFESTIFCDTPMKVERLKVDP